MPVNEIDLNEYRRALSCFATGVAVVTALDADGQKFGMTISSFNSVSLDPPLVLWSIAEDANSYDRFIAAEHFAVNVLAMHQKDLSSRFAQKGTDKFEGLECRDGIEGVPILPEYAACFECSTEHRYDGGDHKIIVGRVQRFEDRENDPLIFYRGRFLRKGGPYPDGSI
ncbi:MAG: flavin reductase family protein [Gammaproteobacteria bacterium]|nr:flavin reductase family protein [Gammaproteobacteria bacterium]